jgi:hypothetical protein
VGLENSFFSIFDQILKQLNDVESIEQHHLHLSNKDCLTAFTAYLVCFISTVNVRSKKKERKEAFLDRR